MYNTLRQALEEFNNDEKEKSNNKSIKEMWHTIETAKPLVFIMDQVEEVYTTGKNPEKEIKIAGN